MKATVLAVLGVVLISACVAATTSLQRESSSVPQVKQILTTQVSSLNAGGLSPFKVTTNQLGKHDLRVTYFFDNLHGWAGGGNQLFRTSDGGITWKSLKVQIPAGAGISRIVFRSQGEGWLILERTAPFLVNYNENHFWIMHSSDGGGSWQLQYERSAAKATSLFIDASGSCWVMGGQYSGIARYSYLILHTRDRHNWEDLSQNLKAIVATKETPTPNEINDVIVGGFSLRAGEATIITGRKQVFVTGDAGNSWKEVASIVEDELEGQSAVRRFASARERSWFARSTDSTEGIHSGLAIEGAKDSWGEYELDRVYFADVVSLSGSEFLASGYMKTTKTTERKLNQITEAVVLYTSDDGRNWSIVYRSTIVSIINSVAVLNSNHVWAVGDRGLILRLERSF